MSKQLTLPDLIQGRAYLEVQLLLLNDALQEHPNNDALAEKFKEVGTVYEHNTDLINKHIEATEPESSCEIKRSTVPRLVEERLSRITRAEVGTLTQGLFQDVEGIVPSHQQNNRILNKINSRAPSPFAKDARYDAKLVGVEPPIQKQ